MAGERSGAYSEVESLKKGKHKIAKDYRRNELLLSLVFAFIICFLFNYNELFSKDTFFFSIFDYIKAIKKSVAIVRLKLYSIDLQSCQ